MSKRKGSGFKGSGFRVLYHIDLLANVKISGLLIYLQAVRTALWSRFGTLNGSTAQFQYFPTLNAEPRTFDPQAYIFVINFG